MEDFRAETCCFTGHRDIPKCDERKILVRVHNLLGPLLDKGVKYFGVGGAVGFDMLMAEDLLDLRDKDRKKIRIISVLPYPGYQQDLGWSEEELCRQERIMRRSDKVSYVSETNCKDVYLMRNRKLVDESGYCISYCNRQNGGTAYTVRYAVEQGLQVFNASSWDLSQLGGACKRYRG